MRASTTGRPRRLLSRVALIGGPSSGARARPPARPGAGYGRPDQWGCSWPPIALTISRQVRSHSRHALAHAFISGESNLSHSAAHALHASAQAAQAWTISGLWLAMRSADRSQNLGSSGGS